MASGVALERPADATVDVAQALLLAPPTRTVKCP